MSEKILRMLVFGFGLASSAFSFSVPFSMIIRLTLWLVFVVLLNGAEPSGLTLGARDHTECLICSCAFAVATTIRCHVGENCRYPHVFAVS